MKPFLMTKPIRLSLAPGEMKDVELSDVNNTTIISKTKGVCR